MMVNELQDVTIAWIMGVCCICCEGTAHIMEHCKTGHKPKMTPFAFVCQRLNFCASHLCSQISGVLSMINVG